MEKLQMFDCFLSNDKSNAFRIGIQLFAPHNQKTKNEYPVLFFFMPSFFENFDFSNPRFFELFNLSIGSSKNQDTTVTYIETVLKAPKTMSYERGSP